MDTTTIAGFALISIIICASPGPTMFFVLSQGLSGDRKAAAAAVISATIANLVWVMLSATGLATIIYSSIIAFEILRIIGACYLIYIGIQIWKNGLGTFSKARPLANLLSVFLRGLIISWSNPKALIFYISFLPQFIQSNAPFTEQIVQLGSVYIVVVFIVMSAYAFLGGYFTSMFKRNSVSRLFSKLLGGTFILSGFSILKIARS